MNDSTPPAPVSPVDPADVTHCECWINGEPCCQCGDDTIETDEAPANPTCFGGISEVCKEDIVRCPHCCGEL